MNAARNVRTIILASLAISSANFGSGAEPEGSPPLPRDAPKLLKDVIVVAAGSSITMNRYGCHEIPPWTGGYDRVPPQVNGHNVFFRIFEILNDHENMCWRRLTDKDWNRRGTWPPEHKLPYNDACYGKRVCYAASDPADFAELAVPQGYEKLDLIYTSDPKGDRIRVTIDGHPPPDNAFVDTHQDTRIPPDADLGADVETLDSHGNPCKLPRPRSGITNIVELRARYRLDPAAPHTFRIQRGGDDPDKRILVWGAVYWRGNCVQVAQRAKGGINCGDLPNYHAIQETLALKPDYILMEAISIRAKPGQILQTLEPGLAWCARHKDRFKTLVYAAPMSGCKSFVAWFTQAAHRPNDDAANPQNAAACAEALSGLATRLGLPMVDVGPLVDDWLANNPAASFIPHVHADWYHPNQWGAALFGQAIHTGIRKHWPELPARYVPPLELERK